MVVAKRFLILTQAGHYSREEGLFSYAPYVKEMDLWNEKHQEIVVVAPKDWLPFSAIHQAYAHPNIRWVRVPQLKFNGPVAMLVSIFALPYICAVMFWQMLRANHLHLRCPGNMGALAAVLQMLFPAKPKTVKYAGNWDPKSQQPWSYRWQQKLLRSKFNRNMKVLVYGDWKEQSPNIQPFYTASYLKSMPLDSEILAEKKSGMAIFVGGLVEGKRPQLSLAIAKEGLRKGYLNSFHFFGDGPLREILEAQVGPEEPIFFHGNQNAERLVEAYTQAEYLLFLSRSEGWPKVVAEAMWWSCLPITCPVSCLPQMLDHGNRGALIAPQQSEALAVLQSWTENTSEKKSKQLQAQEWARKYSLEQFKKDIDPWH